MTQDDFRERHVNITYVYKRPVETASCYLYDPSTMITVRNWIGLGLLGFVLALSSPFAYSKEEETAKSVPFEPAKAQEKNSAEPLSQGDSSKPADQAPSA